MVVSVVAWEIEGCISQLCKIQAQVPRGTVPAAPRSGTRRPGEGLAPRPRAATSARCPDGDAVLGA